VKLYLDLWLSDDRGERKDLGCIEARGTSEGTATLGHYVATLLTPRALETASASIGLLSRAATTSWDLAARAFRALGLGAVPSDDSEATAALVAASDRLRAALREPSATNALAVRDACRAYDEARMVLAEAVRGAGR
jgi:hypothetical protein